MRFKILIVTFSVLFISITLQSKPAVILDKSSSGYTMEFELPDVEITDVDTLGLVKRSGYGSTVFSRISVSEYSRTEDVGKPELPFLFFYMAIANPNQVPTFEVLNRVEQNIYPNQRIFPAQEPWVKNQTAKDRFLSIDSKYYAGSGTIAPTVSATEVFMIRGVPIVTVQINPFTYNPSENNLTVLKKFTLKINTSSSNMVSGLDSKAMESFLRYVLVNFNSAVEPVRNTGRADDYLIVTAPDFESGLSEFVSFRNRRFNVTLATTSQTGTGASSIKSYIEDQNPTYCLLVGDVDEIPGSPGGSNLTDLYYSTTDGDYYPEIFIGRFSVASSSELSNIVYKTIYMEENLGKIDKRNCFLGGVDNNYYQVAEGSHNYVIDSYLDDAGYENEKFYCQNNTISESDFTDALNTGVIFNFYSAHGSNTSWGAGDFSLSGSDMKNLTNTTHYAFQYGFCCLSGTYSTGECFTEAAIRGEGGSVAAIGATISTTWTPDDLIERGIFDGLFDPDDPQTTVSASLNAGKMSNSSQKETYFEVYNIMGDPAASMLPINVGPYLSVIEPSGGVFYVGDKVTVKWETGNGANVANVKIDYSTDNGGTFQTLIASTPNDSSHEWTIPDIPESDQCIIQVSDVGGTLLDVSGVFSILQKAAIALDPAALTAQADLNQSVDKSLTVTNNGKGKLTYSISVAGAGGIMINELYVPKNAFDDGLEIWNRGSEQDMTGWKIEWKDNVNSSGTYSFESGFILKSGKTIVLTDAQGSTNDSTFYMGENVGWDRETDTELSVALLDDGGKGVDFVRSSGNNDDPPAGTEWNGTGVDLSGDYVYRKSNDDNDNADDWGAGSSGTVNQINPGQSISDRADYWLTVDPNQGTIDALQNISVKVTFNSTGLTTGQYRDTLIVTHNSADIASPILVPCLFNVDMNAITNIKNLITSFGMSYYNTRIVYQIPIITNSRKAQVSIKLYNLQGKMIRTLVNEPKGYGTYFVELSNINSSLAAGVYLVKMEVADFKKTMRIIHK